MALNITTFLMFEGDAEAAMNFYVSLFDNSVIKSIERYGADEAGAEGSVVVAKFNLDGIDYMCIDSAVPHDFGFTAAMSLFVDCKDEAEIHRLFDGLAAEGEVLMPLDQYPFSRKFGWCADRFGVSWQLSLE